MKKILTCTFLLLSLFINQHSFAKEMATWGPTGSDCKNLIPFLDSEEGKLLVESEIRGFLNGLNVQLLIQDENSKLKIINHNSIDTALNFIIKWCKQNPDGGTPLAVLEYYESLPSFK